MICKNTDYCLPTLCTALAAVHCNYAVIVAAASEGFVFGDVAPEERFT